MKDNKISELIEQLNEFGYKYLLVTEKVSESDPNIRETSVAHCIEKTLTKSFAVLAATLAREATSMDNPELLQFLHLTNEFIIYADRTFLEKHIQETK